MRLIDGESLYQRFLDYKLKHSTRCMDIDEIRIVISDEPTVDALDKIRNEIKDEMDDIASGCVAKYSYDEGYYRGLSWVLRKIDKYK